MSAFKLVLLFLVVVGFGQANDWPVTDHLALALVALLLGAFVWSRVSLGGVAVTRETATDRAQVGQTLVERIEVRNAGRLGKLWLEVNDYSTLPNHQVGRVVHVRGRGVARWQVETRCVRRGRFRVGPLVLRSGDPLGLFPARLAVPGAHELTVYPAALDLRGFPMPAGLLAGGKALERRTPFVTPSVAGVRDYVPGDAFSRISWAATARLGRMMVKEFDLDPTADVWLVLDLDRRVHTHATRPLDLPPADEPWPVEAWLDSTEEYAVTIAASFARRFLEQGRNVGLIATGAHHEVIPADRSDRQYVKILESLAVVRADGQLPLAEALVAAARRFSRQSSTIVITPSTEEAWVAALSEITGRRVRASAVIVEPATFGAAPASLLVVSNLAAAGVPTHLVKYGDNIAAALSSVSGAGVGAGTRGTSRG